MSSPYEITDIAVQDGLVWMTLQNAPKSMLEPGTLHLRTFYQIEENELRPLPDVIAEAVKWLRTRAFHAEKQSANS
jgi:hypothetical protein